MGLQPSVLSEKVSLSLVNSQVTDTATQSKTPDWLCHDKVKTVFIKVPYLFKSTICLHPSQPKSFPSSSFRLQIHTKTQAWTNWMWTGVNHGPFKRTTALNTLPPSKSLLLNKGVKRCFCLPSFWRRREAWKTQMNMKIGTKWQTHNRNAGQLIHVLGN